MSKNRVRGAAVNGSVPGRNAVGCYTRGCSWSPARDPSDPGSRCHLECTGVPRPRQGQFTQIGQKVAGSPATCSKDLVKLHLWIRNHLGEIF